MTTVEEVLRTYGDGIGVDDFADQLAHALRVRVASDPRALSRHDRNVLARIGVPAMDLADHLPTGRTVVETAADLVTANSILLPAADVAARLGRSVVRIRGAIADGSLYGVKVGRSWLLPRWQLTDDAGPIPHLRTVIASIPEGTSAVTIQRVMTEPTDELFLDGRAVCPRVWLIAGQSTAPVVQMIEYLYAW